MSRLPTDCLNEIFEYLEKDKDTLYSCLLVNRLWCKTSVRILWRDGLDYNVWTYNTLVACLPNESKEILYDNGIIISTPTSNPPMFNYPAFCKMLSIIRVNFHIELLLLNQQSISSQYSCNNVYIVSQEIYKLYMSQIISLKELSFYQFSDINFTIYPGAKYCLKNLKELRCSSNISKTFFYHLSQICHNLSLLNIIFKNDISEGLKDLISVQKNLKYLIITQHDCYNLIDIIPIITTKLPNTLIKLYLYRGGHYLQWSKCLNLQELELSFDYNDFKDFEIFQYIKFPKLQILKIQDSCPKYELLINFLEINGKNLKELYVGDIAGDSDNLLNLSIAKFCINLKKLSIGFKNNEMDTLKIVFNNCQYLESIKIWCGGEFLSEKEALEAVLKYSRNNVYELILYHVYYVQSELLPEELETFFINWSNRIPQKSISLIIINNDDSSLDANDENIKIIDKYYKLGIIKKFKVTGFDDEEFNLKSNKLLKIYD
ncbi:hypothetical protein C1645_832030 [Glomus cerebriforme]|uniref:F-box domain-containing protein n=1 Tax=Glomus cerebriforme TaxID=658196 RepID=A0A397SEE4_9GLOM|nr:hypothetical protein C1645_832030 [Glomus cerebriforme]